MEAFKWKICGLRDRENIREVALLQPDMIGFIFYPPSPRYAATSLKVEDLNVLPGPIRKVGVFVNEESGSILSISKKYGFDFAQLHGDELPAQCAGLKKEGLGILKAFNIGTDFDFVLLKPYEKSVDYFLFDTKGDLPGGNSLPFDWVLLEKYDLRVPFLLSGGISLENVDKIQQIRHPMMAGIDVNSRFEIEPGYKDLVKLRTLKKKLIELELR